MKREWFAYNSPAQHRNFGSVKINHRSNFGHCRGILATTGQHFECLTENLTFPAISTGGTGPARPPRGAKTKKRMTKREKKLASLPDSVKKLLAELALLTN